MTLGNFEKSSHMTPLLVRLYDSHQLYELLEDDKPQARAEIAGAASELFEQELSAREEELLADIMIGLMRQAETDLRQALSEKLAGQENVPLRLVLHMANDEISVAAPVLQQSLVLSDLDLIYIIKAKGPAYWQVIAAREQMSDDLIDVLADTKDSGTALVLSQNERITLTKHALGILAEAAQNDDNLAKPLLMRQDVPTELAMRLYDHVGRELKSYIKAFYKTGDPAASEAEQTVDELMLAFADSKPASVYMPTEKMIEKARDQAEVNMLNMNGMLDALDNGEIAAFISQFSAYTGIGTRKIHDFLKQSCPKGMAIACRAFRVQKNDFAKIYLLTHRMRSAHRMVNHKDMLEVLAYFEKIRPEAAMRIVSRENGEIRF